MSYLRKKYDKKTIGQIEGEIKKNNELSLESKKASILLLRYLQSSGRFKENPLYRKSNFENYLSGVYNMRLNTFMESSRAFSKYPEESCKYGVGLISKVFRKCSSIKGKKVLAEIKIADEKSKIPLKRDKIEVIINKYSRPIPPAKPTYKELYVEEVRRHDIAKDQYQEAIIELVAARSQISKLKRTVIKLKAQLKG